MIASIPERPQPRTTPETEECWRAGTRGQFLLGTCSACGHVHFPTQAACPFCWSPSSTVQSSGRGEVEAVSVVYQHSSPDMRPRLPYAIAYIRLAEGPALTCAVRTADPESVAIGDRVSVVFEPGGDELANPLFKVAAHA